VEIHSIEIQYKYINQLTLYIKDSILQRNNKRDGPKTASETLTQLYYLQINIGIVQWIYTGSPPPKKKYATV